MNWKKRLSLLALLSLLWIGLSAQEKNYSLDERDYSISDENYEFDETLHAYYKGMQTFILEQAAAPMPVKLKELLNIAKADNPHFTGKDITEIIRNYWKFEYLTRNPMPETHIDNARNEQLICVNGGFEDDFSGYKRYRSVFNDHHPKCRPTQNNLPLTWEFLVPIPATYPADYPFDFKITDQGLDPNVPASFGLDKVRFGEHAMMINEIKAYNSNSCGRGNFGIDRIVKAFTVDEDHEKFAVWFATVLQDPVGHIGANYNDKPFFNIQFYDAQDNLVDELCWDSTEDFFINHPTGQTSCGFESAVRIQPWTCTIFDFAGYQNQTLRMEIITADCGQSAHFGYAYVDGICDYCATIDISAPDLDCASLPYTVVGNVNILDSDVSNLQLISLEGILSGDDGSEIVTTITTYNSSSGTFFYSIPETHINSGVCYDFYAVGTFQNGIEPPFEIRSATLIQGEFNDFCADDFSTVRLNYAYELECIDIGHPRNITNDEYKITLDVITSGPDVEWEIIRNGWDVIASGMGNQTVMIGAYNYQDCDYFELHDPICDKRYFINIEYNCEGCINAFRICDHEIICDDNGTPGFPHDDLWSISWIVESESGVGTWRTVSPNVTGLYNQLTTIFMGELDNYGPTYTFRIYDPVTRCILRYDVEVPQGCKSCDFEYQVVVSDCKPNPCLLGGRDDYIFTFDLILPTVIDFCAPEVYIEIGDQDYLPLPYHITNTTTLTFGTFNVGAGPFTILVEDCLGCLTEFVIFPPNCHGGTGIGTGRGLEMEAQSFKIMPNPTSDLLNLNTPNLDEVYTLRLVNMMGQVVMKMKNISGDQQLDLSEIPVGVYHVVLSKESKIIWTEKVVKI